MSGEGIALGVISDYTYTNNTLKGWKPGSVILIGTDGINETRNDAGEMFGFNRLHQIIFNNLSESAEVIQNAVIDALLSFKDNTIQEDDITLVIIKLL